MYYWFLSTGSKPTGQTPKFKNSIKHLSSQGGIKAQY